MMNKILILSILLNLLYFTLNHKCVHNQLQNKNSVTEILSGMNKAKTPLFQTTFQPLRIKIDYTNLDTDVENRQCTSTGATFKAGNPSSSSNVCPSDRSSVDDCYGTCSSGEVVSSAKVSIIKNIFNQIVPYFQTLLSIRRPTSLRLATGNCIDYTPIPTSYTSSSFTDADLILFVVSRPVSTGVLAWAAYCQTVSSRPVAGVVNVAPSNLETVSSAALLSTLKHEVLHALGFSANAYSSFKDSNGNSYAKVTESFTDSYNGASVTRVKYLLSNAIAAARIQYNCPSLSYLLLEEFGSSGTAGSHWEKLQHGRELMTGVTDNTGYDVPLTAVTLGLLQDTGFYSVNVSMAEYASWGQYMGCDFYNARCENWGTYPNSRDGYFCDTNGKEMCTHDYYAKTVCQVATYNNNLGFYQHLTNTKQGGYSPYSEYCPLPAETGTSYVSCKSSTTGSAALGETYGSSSGCFRSTLVKGTISSSGLRCHVYSCSKSTGSWVLTVTPNGATGSLTCSAKGDISASSVGFTGTLTCPDPTEFCTIITSKGTLVAGPPGTNPNYSMKLSFSLFSLFILYLILF